MHLPLHHKSFKEVNIHLCQLVVLKELDDVNMEMP
jgi:hypothetical protein